MPWHIILPYAFIAGLVGNAAVLAIAVSLNKKTEGSFKSDLVGLLIISFTIGLFWPVTVPAMVSFLLFYWLAFKPLKAACSFLSKP